MLTHNLTIRLDTFGTALCSALSLIGSILVILSFLHVKSISSKPRAARLILNLALADCVWFSAALIQACFWVFQGSYGEPGHVPPGVCMVCSPLVTLSRISSLLWTCVIAFEAVQTVKKRKWLFEVENSQFYDYAYFIFVYALALPGFFLAIYKQHSGNTGLGCEPDFEKLGSWYEIFFIELLPITLGFLINVYAFFQVRKTLSSRAFPRSVRKRRKRVMYHYIKICMLCWGPTILFYILEICGLHYALLEVISRILLYTTGFFNFLVFGMQDPHLNRSFRFVFKSVGLGFCCGVSEDTNLRRNSREKTVMFENAEKVNADISKDKRTVYRYHRLSKEEKLELYNERPDLNTKDRSHLLKQPLLADEPKSQSTRGVSSPNSGQQPIKSALKKSRQTDESISTGKTVSRVVCADDRSGNSSSTQQTGSTDSSNRQALKIGSRDDELVVSPNTSMDLPNRSSPNHYRPPSASSVSENTMEVRDSISVARANGWGSSAPGKDLEEGDLDDDENMALVAANLVSFGQTSVIDSNREHDEQGSQKTSSSQRSSERDSIFNADNEGDEEESSSESEGEDSDEGVIGWKAKTVIDSRKGVMVGVFLPEWWITFGFNKGYNKPVKSSSI